MNDNDGYIKMDYEDRETCPACNGKKMDSYKLVGGPEGSEIIKICARCGHREIESLETETATWEDLAGKTTIFMTDDGKPEKVIISDIPREGVLEFIAEGVASRRTMPILGKVRDGDMLSLKSSLYKATFLRVLSEKEDPL